MRFSESYIPTLKESPAEAEVISHKLLLRSGMIRKLTSGIYAYLPLGYKSLKKISRIVEEEMARAGFQELMLPMVQPGDLWKETRRWDHYGKELLRFRDRNERDYCLGPTHEEVITSIVRDELRSYKQLPLRVFQIQTKFRDEMRPRFGLMRGREFLMKDAYSFDQNTTEAEKSYKLMFEAYTRIFRRLGLDFRAVEADTGSIGGTFSHEFMILAEAGEDTIAVCDKCGYAANVERAEAVWKNEPCLTGCLPVEKKLTPNMHTVIDVANEMHVSRKSIVKTMLYMADGKPVAVLVRGDRKANGIKLKNMLKAVEVELATPEQVEELTKAPLGFAGPIGLEIPVYADLELQGGSDYVTGANEKDMHFFHVDLNRDVKIAGWADLREVVNGDRCPRCDGVLSLKKGIEAGHIFMLGTKYSEAMHGGFLDENGKEQLMIMGCYGIGISRLVAASIEQNHDADGIIFPPAVAPFECIIINLDPKNGDTTKIAENIYEKIKNLKIDVLLDDRTERPGIKFKDADLLGAPLQLIVGQKNIKKGVIEAKNRKTGEKIFLSLKNFDEDFTAFSKNVYKSWGQN